jgi:hypothetical protein
MVTGLLQSWGAAPAQQSEPQRLGQQIRPEALRLLNSDEARRVESAVRGAARGPECLQAGLFDERQATAVRQTLEPLLPPGAWSLDAAVEPPRWIIYMGKYLTPDAVNKKKAELRQFGVSFEGCPTPAWSLACRWAALPARRRHSSSWTGWPSAACARRA